MKHVEPCPPAVADRHSGYQVGGTSPFGTKRQMPVYMERSIADLPDGVHGLSVITPPPITERVVEEAAKKGIRRLWMQPGAESAKALERAAELGLEVIAHGPCLLVVLGFRE